MNSPFACGVNGVKLLFNVFIQIRIISNVTSGVKSSRLLIITARFERILEVTQPTETGDCRSYNRDHKMSFTVRLRVENIVLIKVMLQFVV